MTRNSDSYICIVVYVCVFGVGSNENTTNIGAEFLHSVINELQAKRIEMTIQQLIASHLLSEKGDLNSFEDQGDEARDPTLRNKGYLPQVSNKPDDFVVEDLEDGNHNIQGGDPGIPPLSKEELIALYQAAISKGSGLNLSTLPTLGNLKSHKLPVVDTQNDIVAPTDHGTLPGYYYYFYPIKSFMANAAQTNASVNTMMPMSTMPNGLSTDMMSSGMMMTDGNSEKSIEPLFIAMASFVGVAMMFILSILFMPKFGNLSSRGEAALKNAPEEMVTLTRIIGEAIEGKDCSDRIACEVGRAIRIMKLGNKPIRILEIMLPPNLAKQMAQIRRSANKKEKCHFVPCRQKTKKPDKQKQIQAATNKKNKQKQK